jgi:hypothetical protein
MDCGYNGMIVTIAETKEKAIERMKQEMNFDPSIYVQEFPITQDFIYANYGDL